ncbi:MAG: class I SAM-dependent methyltransferase [Flavobacterium sp.]|nr:MAG: class I SAM-dependent methyltransferase [Flavobacterium sp.]
MKATYDLIGLNYNASRKADPQIFDRLLSHLSPSPQGLYLDIGCGTGNYTKEFAKRDYRFIGVDPSRAMLDVAEAETSNVTWQLGSAETISLPAESIDGVIATLTMHHWQNLEAGFKRLSDVLKPGGKLVIFTSHPAQMKGYWLCHYFPEMMKHSMLQMPAFELIEQLLSESGLTIATTEKYFVHSNLQDLFLYSGKHDPRRYLDPNFRRGISSFSSLANKIEVNKGLQKLQADIESGQIDKIISKYENNLGDYLFISAKKHYDSIPGA